MRISSFLLTAVCLLFCGCQTPQSSSHTHTYKADQQAAFTASQRVLRQMAFAKVEGDAASGGVSASSDVDTIAGNLRWRTAQVQISRTDDGQTQVDIVIRNHSATSPAAMAQAAGTPLWVGDGTYSAFFELLSAELSEPAPAAPPKQK